MIPANDFITKEMPRMKSFLEDLCVAPKRNTNPSTHSDDEILNEIDWPLEMAHLSRTLLQKMKYLKDALEPDTYARLEQILNGCDTLEEEDPNLPESENQTAFLNEFHQSLLTAHTSFLLLLNLVMQEADRTKIVAEYNLWTERVSVVQQFVADFPLVEKQKNKVLIKCTALKVGVNDEGKKLLKLTEAEFGGKNFDSHRRMVCSAVNDAVNALLKELFAAVRMMAESLYEDEHEFQKQVTNFPCLDASFINSKTKFKTILSAST